MRPFARLARALGLWYPIEPMKAVAIQHVVVFALALSASACSKETPPAAEEPRSPSAESGAAKAAPAEGQPAAATTPAAASAAPAPAVTAQSKFSEDNFEVVLQPKGSYKSGQAGEAEIVLSAKGEFHVNSENYPFKFKINEAPGLKPTAPIVTKESMKLEPGAEPKRGTMTVAFTPESAGKHTLSGNFAFSVCAKDKCLLEKRDLALEITAN